MDVLILSSASEKIDDHYNSIARDISNFLIREECNLIYGGSSTSMMGACYDQFQKNNRTIHAYTVEKYKDDLVNLDKAKTYIRENTFKMKESMYNNCDLIVVLAGGTGTLSEFTSYMEENRSGERQVPIIMYDEDEFYKYLFMHFRHASKQGFISEDIFNNFKYTTNNNEFKNAFWDVIYNINNEKTRGER